ncbi:nuclear transport factor 2 family protein [uncultured Neptuniibacter sp.]|uniref:nuclear transport factor 2 family protein n=1 Tax=uncultured Neptuniibacter sp. TaxID=502143 RepID=UPI00260D64CE|nr:nuclear transport factor 2 family protein [uncultured Neptuniibacter sp.]
MTKNIELELCKDGINAWKKAFNNQDAAGCAAQYTIDAVMEARPFGIFKGREEIQNFWQDIIDKGFSDVAYSDVHWEKAENGGYLLTSKWTMNTAFGVVHSEHWIIDSDGKARLVNDIFEVLGER